MRFDSMLGSFGNTLGITEEFMAAAKPCFESKLNYLLNYSKGADFPKNRYNRKRRASGCIG